MDTKRWNYKVEILKNEHICLNFYKIVVCAKEIAKAASAGQFCMLSVENAYLKRPLSIYDTDKQTVSFLYKVVGKGTDYLSKLKKGDSINITGPLGSCYPLEPEKNKIPFLVAGGTGIASIHFLAKQLNKKGLLFYGAKNKDELLCVSELKKLGFDLLLATEDGSCGFKGFITDLFDKNIKDNSIVYVCGPNIMANKIIKTVNKLNLEGYASLEEKMACGIGVCQGCAINVGNTKKLVCKDGPVFEMSLL